MKLFRCDDVAITIRRREMNSIVDNQMCRYHVEVIEEKDENFSAALTSANARRNVVIVERFATSM